MLLNSQPLPLWAIFAFCLVSVSHCLAQGANVLSVKRLGLLLPSLCLVHSQAEVHTVLTEGVAASLPLPYPPACSFTACGSKTGSLFSDLAVCLQQTYKQVMFKICLCH